MGHNKKDCERKHQPKLFKIGSKHEIRLRTTTGEAESEPGKTIQHIKMNKANEVARQLRHRLVTS